MEFIAGLRIFKTIGQLMRTFNTSVQLTSSRLSPEIFPASLPAGILTMKLVKFLACLSYSASVIGG